MYILDTTCFYNKSVLEFDTFFFGGGVLTSPRIRGTQVLHSTEDKAVGRLEGIGYRGLALEDDFDER